MFQAVATAQAASSGAYRPGDRHAMIVLARQAAASGHDWDAAESGIRDGGWTDVSFQRAGILDPENLNGKSKEFLEAFEYAVNGGCGLIVYSDPVAEDG